MSRWLIAGTVLGGIGGAVAATVAVLDYVRIKDEADYLRQITRLVEAQAEAGIDLSDPAIKSQTLEAAQPIASLLSRNLNALSPEEVGQLPGVEDAKSGETVSFTLPDGREIFITFRWNNFAPAAVITFEGEDMPTRAGWTSDVPDSECQVIFAGPTRDEPPMGRFRMVC